MIGNWNGNEPLGMGGNGIEKNIPAHIRYSQSTVQGERCINIGQSSTFQCVFTFHSSETFRNAFAAAERGWWLQISSCFRQTAIINTHHRYLVLLSSNSPNVTWTDVYFIMHINCVCEEDILWVVSREVLHQSVQLYPAEHITDTAVWFTAVNWLVDVQCHLAPWHRSCNDTQYNA